MEIEILKQIRLDSRQDKQDIVTQVIQKYNVVFKFGFCYCLITKFNCL